MSKLLLSIIIAFTVNMIGLAQPNGVMCVIGDSYVRNHHCPVEETWHFKAAKQLGMKYLNFGINGNCVGYDRTSEGYGKAIIDRIEDLPDSVTMILIIAGHNDAAMIAEHEDYSVEKFSNSLNVLLKKTVARYPDAAIGYVTPWNVKRIYFEEVISEIKRVCKSNRIPILDASKCLIDANNPEFRKKYFQGEKDTAHLNDEGHNLLIEWGKEFILNIMKDKGLILMD